jgi:TRAP-type mannitol/chloroaromatic compound transport system substrate-binding protein
MDRRDFLRSTGGIAALATGCASAAAPATDATNAQSGPIRTYSFASPWAAHYAGFADDARRLGRRIEAATGGVFALDFRSGSGDHADFALRPVQSHVLHHPAFAIFGGLPGYDVLMPRELDAWLATGGGQDLWDDLAASQGFKPLLAGHTGPDPVLWSRSPISKSVDLAGQRVIARGLDAEVVRALGAIPILADEMALEAALTAPDTTAVVWGSLVHASASDIPAHFPHGLFGALGSAGGALALEIDLAVWNDLTDAQQSAIAAVAHSEFRMSIADAEATRVAVTQAIATRTGAVFAYPTPEFTAAVSRIAGAVVAHTAAHDAVAARIDRSYSAFRRAIRSPAVNIA